MKTVLLISGPVLHYRVSVYNYLSRRFREHGWEFKTLTNGVQPGNQRPVRFELREEPFNFRRYAALVLEMKPEAVILFVHLKEPIFWPLIHWLKWKRVPVICWTKGTNLDAKESVWRDWLFNYVHGLSDSIILYSAKQLDRLGPRHRAKAIVANNTINFEDIPEVKESKEQIKAEIGLHFKRLVLFVGTMGLAGERKKVEHLIEAFRNLEREDIGAVIVGAGLPEALQARINPKNTRYLGALYDPRDLKISRLFKAADLFVVPGHIGLGLNQAFYWGLPVVTEAGLQPPEIHLLKTGRNGFMVPQNDVAQLKEKMLYLLGNDGEREAFSRHAREDVLREASTENMFQNFLRAVEYASASRAGAPARTTLMQCKTN